jgi:cytidylate kinase
VSLVPAVRRALVRKQREIGEKVSIVMEGRDIGTVVFPMAELKIFLEAAPEVRAQRRWKEHQEKGASVTLAQVLVEVRERDRRDRERKVSPLVRAGDAILVDNTAMNIEETAKLVVMLARQRDEQLSRVRGTI